MPLETMPRNWQAEMLATTLDVEFGPDKILGRKEADPSSVESRSVPRTMNMTQSAVGRQKARWTTVKSRLHLIFE